MDKKTILITGASGFTGYHACEYFTKEGYEVVGLVRRNGYTPSCDIKIRQCNIANNHEVIQVFKETKPAFILHLAGQNHAGESWKDPVSSFYSNTVGTFNLLEAMRLICPKSTAVIIGSALEFNPCESIRPPHPYSITKMMQVKLALYWSQLYNLNIVIAKPSNLIGPGPSNGVCSLFAERIVEMERQKREPHLVVHDILTTRDFVDVRDVIKAYDLLLQKGKNGEVYEIASGVSRTLEDVIKMYQKHSIRQFHYHSNVSDQHHSPVTIDLTRINELGWQPETSFEDSLLDIINDKRHEALG
jgi:GDP-4-dehydro-6-deoxy-D-mannose reductase